MRTRSIIALLVLLLGAAGSLWIVSPDSFKSNAPSTLSFASSTDEKDPRFTNETSALTSGASSDISEENVAQNFGREILRLNPQGQGKDAPIKLPNDIVLSKMLQDEISKPIPIHLYEEGDIIVLKSTDKKSALVYTTALDAASKKTLELPQTDFTQAIVQFVTKNEAQELTAHANAISSYIATLLIIPVPANWKVFHLALINLMQKKLAYTNAILYNNDSQLKIAAALNGINSLVDEEQNLYSMIAEITHNPKL